MPMVYPSNPLMRMPSGGSQSPPGMTSPALDALQRLGSASPSSGSRPNPNRLTENDVWGQPQAKRIPPPATPPGQQPIIELMLNSLKMAYPSDQTTGPAQRREKPGFEIGNSQ